MTQLWTIRDGMLVDPLGRRIAFEDMDANQQEAWARLRQSNPIPEDGRYSFHLTVDVRARTKVNEFRWEGKLEDSD